MKKLKALACAVSALVLCAGLFAGCGGGDDGEGDVCTHTNLTKVEGKDATCLETGNFVYYRCECGALFADKNGQKSTTLQDVTIEKKSHDMHYYTEQAAGYSSYYFCNTCGRFYTDENGESEIPYDQMLDSSVTPAQLTNGWTDPAGINTLNRDFTLRCFVGWTDTAGNNVSTFPNNGKVMVNFNFNRKCTLVENPPDSAWYGFGVQYSAENGLRYRNFGTDTRTDVAREFTDLFVKNGGIWVRVVRKGTDCSFYFEDKYGIPILISSHSGFGADEALCKFSVLEAERVSGWAPSAFKIEICWNIANPRCVFTNE